MKEGLYVLDKPVSNPKPDRRNDRDWHKQINFPAGTYKVEVEKLEFGKGVTREIPRIRPIKSRWSSNTINRNSNPEQFAVLEAALKPIARPLNLREVLSAYDDISAANVLTLMFENGLVSQVVIEKIQKQLADMTAEEFEALIDKHSM